MKFYFGLLYGVSICALYASSALAQEAAPQAAASVDEGGFADIVVTANRREQKVQDVPIAISAISGQVAAQQGVTGTASLQTMVPNLVFARAGNNAQPFLRGLGSSSGLPTAEPSVAIYVDGVYHPSANANFFEFNNVERIEVLKGPQGTLFGRNATGGVIQIITKDPGGTPEADFRVGYANYQTVTANAYLSAPITDTLGANIAVLYKKQNEGWGTNIFTGKETVPERTFGARGKLVWEQGGATTVRLAGDYSHYINSAINGQNPPGSTAGGLPFPGKYNTRNNFEQRADIETGGVSLKIDHDFDALQVMSLSAYRKTEGYWNLDQDISPFPIVNFNLNQSSRMYSQELHLLSPSSSKLQWLAGAYYFNYKAAYDPSEGYGYLFYTFAPGRPTLAQCIQQLAFCDPNAGTDATTGTKSTSFAVFAQGTYPLLDNTNLTFGIRYTWDKVDYFGTTRFHGTNIIVPGTGGPSASQLKHDKPTFRISIDHKFTPDIMAYASFNRGVKTGTIDAGLSNTVAGSRQIINPEQVNAYEAGIKTELFGRKVRFNLGGFYYDFKNLQYQKIFVGVPTLFNAPNGAQMYGLDAEINAKVTDQLTFNGGLGYLHSKIRDFPNAPNTCQSSVTGVNDAGGFFCNGPDGLPDPANRIPYNAEGNRTPNSPEWTINAGAVYTIPSSVGEFTLAGNASYTSTRYFEIDNRTNNPGQWLFSASAMWTDPSEHLSLRVWGRNLSGEYYYMQYTGQANGPDIAAPAPPREYGVTLGYRF